MIKKINNTIAYRMIFKCVPDDMYKTFEDLRKTVKEYNIPDDLIEQNKIYKDNIHGQIVEFPLNFLSAEKLNRKFFSMERYIPLKLFI